MVLLVLVGLVAVFAQRVVLNPELDPAEPAPGRPADAVVVLGGYGDDTVALGQQVLADGLARQLVISNPYGRDDNLTTRVCADPGPRVSCFVPRPGRTIGEAQEIARRASAEGWTSVTLVTGLVHASRARYIVGQCYTGPLAVIAPTTPPSTLEVVAQVPYQAAGFVRAFLEGGC